MLEIRPVRSREDADAVRTLAYEFIDWMRGRYPEMTAEIDNYLEALHFDEQIRDVRPFYTPPAGECLLALLDSAPAGIVMLKDTGEKTCEMNRMFVRDRARGQGIGRKLVDRLMTCAGDMGFETMTLSALPRHDEAIALYRSVGFDIDNRPPEPGNSSNAVLMKLALHPQKKQAGEN